MQRPELFQKLAGALVGRRWRRDPDLDVRIAASCAAQRGHSLAAQPQLLAVLRAGWNANLSPSVDRRHVELGPERRFSDGDRHGAMNIITDPPEERVRLDLRDDQEIAGRSSVPTGASLSGDADARTVVDSGRNVDADRLGVMQDPGALAVPAPLVREDALAAASPAGRSETKLSREVADPAGARAVGAGATGARRHPSRAATTRARGFAIDGQRGGEPAHGVEESETERVRDILAAARSVPLHDFGTATAQDLREERRHPSETSEVSEVERRGEIGSTPGAVRSGRGRGPLQVVRPALGRIAEDLVRLADLLEALLRRLVSGIQVGMILARQLPVGFLDFGGARLSGHTEDLIVVHGWKRHLQPGEPPPRGGVEEPVRVLADVDLNRSRLGVRGLGDRDL